MSSSLWPRGLQHPRFLCPPISPGVCSNSWPLSWWCYLTISSVTTSFSSYLQSFLTSGYFPMNQLFVSGDQSYWKWSHPHWVWLHLYLITSAKIPFPSKIKSQLLKLRLQCIFEVVGGTIQPQHTTSSSGNHLFCHYRLLMAFITININDIIEYVLRQSGFFGSAYCFIYYPYFSMLFYHATDPSVMCKKISCLTSFIKLVTNSHFSISHSSGSEGMIHLKIYWHSLNEE